MNDEMLQVMSSRGMARKLIIVVIGSQEVIIQHISIKKKKL